MPLVVVVFLFRSP